MNMSTPMSPKPLVNATCKLGKKGCFEDGRCHALGNCENKIVTKADRIRAMSDEDLATVIWAAFNDNDYLGKLFCDGKAGCLLDSGDFDCNDSKEKGCVLRWLQQPVELLEVGKE